MAYEVDDASPTVFRWLIRHDSQFLSFPDFTATTDDAYANLWRKRVQHRDLDEHLHLYRWSNTVGDWVLVV